MFSFIKSLYYKKKYIIYFLSAILTLVIFNDNVSAYTGSASPSEVMNYTFNSIQLPDITQTPNYDSDLVYNSVLTYDPVEDAFGFAFYRVRSQIDRTPFLSPRSGCTTSDFPVTSSSSCQDWGRVWWNGGSTGYQNMFYIYYIYYNSSTGLYDDFRLGYSGTGNNNFSVRKEATFIWVQNDTPLQSTNNNSYYYNPSYLVSTFPSGFMVNVTPLVTYPSISVLLNDLIYDSKNTLVHRYLFEIDDYDSSYSYFYRFLSFDGTTILNDFSPLNIRDLSSSGVTSYVSDYFYDYSNIRIEIKIVSPDNVVVFDSAYVVSSFSYNNYTEYYFNNLNPYYYISGFTGTSLSVPFYISRSGSSELPVMSVYDFTSKSVIPGFWIQSSSCYIENIFHDNCSYFDISQYSDYDSSHVYGVRVFNPYFSTLFPDDSFIFSFAVENSLYVSYSGDYSDGFISEDYITYVDNSGVLTTVSGIDNLSGDFTTFNSFFNSSVIHFNSFFIFVSSAFNLFFTSLSSPMVWCWVFCFCMVIVAYCIKFFF